VRRAFVLAVLLLEGCAGAKAHIVGDSLRYPVSMSASLPDGDGQVRALGDGLESVGRLRDSWTVVGIGYGHQTRDLDVSAPINARVAELSGDGVVQLAVRSSNCLLNFVFPLNLLPIWPGCVTVAVDGEVVKVTR
jgi:hypothetical protein